MVAGIWLESPGKSLNFSPVSNQTKTIQFRLRLCQAGLPRRVREDLRVRGLDQERHTQGRLPTGLTSELGGGWQYFEYLTLRDPGDESGVGERTQIEKYKIEAFIDEKSIVCDVHYILYYCYRFVSSEL